MDPYRLRYWRRRKWAASATLAMLWDSAEACSYHSTGRIRQDHLQHVTLQHSAARALLVSLPIISSPDEHIAMDVVGVPEGNDLCWWSANMPQYPEAVQIKTIDASSVELITIFFITRSADWPRQWFHLATSIRAVPNVSTWTHHTTL